MLKKILGVYRKLGLEKFLIYLFEDPRWPKWLFFYSRQSLFVCAELKVGKRAVRSFENFRSFLCTLDKDDLYLLAKFWCKHHNDPHVEKKLEYLQQEYDRGMEVYCHKSDGEIQGFICLYPEGGRKIPVHQKFKNRMEVPHEEGFAALGYGFIDPGWRMKGLFIALMKFIKESNPSIRVLMTDINPLNDVSIKSHLRLGFTLFADYRFVVIFKYFNLWLPRFHEKKEIGFRKNITVPVSRIMKG